MDRTPPKSHINRLVGMSCGNTSLVSLVYRLGVRHASLTWNEENEFATGVGSPKTDRDLEMVSHENMERLIRQVV